MKELEREFDSGSARGSSGVAGPVLVSLIVGIVLAAGVFVAVQRWEQGRARAAFDAVATEGARAITRRVERHMHALRAGRAVYRAVGVPGRETFAEFAGELLRRRPDRALIAWLPRVGDDERAGFERDARGGGLRGFRIIEPDGGDGSVAAARRDEYFPVLFIEPANGGEALRGVDFAARSRFQVVMDEAAALARARATGRIPLAGTRRGRYGFFLFQPVYDAARAGSREAQDATRPGGFFALLIDATTLVERGLAGGRARDRARDAGLVVADREAAQGSQVLYHRPGAERPAGSSWRALLLPSGPGLQTRRRIEVAGREWRLTFTPGTVFLASYPQWRAPAAAGAALLFALLAAVQVRAGMRRRRRIDRLEAGLERAVSARDAAVAERARLDSELEALRTRASTAEAVARLGSWCWDPVDGSMSWSPGFYALFGLKPDATVPDLDTFMAQLCEHDRERARRGMAQAVAEGTGIDTEICVVRDDGAQSPMRLRARTERDPDTGTVHLTGTLHEESARHGHDGRHARFLAAALQQTPDPVVLTDLDGVIRYVNPAFERVTGFTRAEALGEKMSLVKSDHHDAAFYRDLWESIRAGQSFRDVFVNRKKDGTLYYEEKTITPLMDAGGRIVSFASIGREITERMQDQERLQHLAYHDLLTGLPNRTLFVDRLTHALLKRRKSGTRLAVLFLDTDEFKHVNDTLGHDVGDRVLQLLAERITSCVREGDTVARIGGDEFTVLLEEVGSTGDVSTIAQKIIDALGRPLRVDAEEVVVTFSIGISLFPDDGEYADTLLKRADEAMYRAKQVGRASYQFYSAALEHRALARLTYESELHRAIEREEFTIHYQPQVDLRSGRVIGIGVEALIRWQHPESGLVGPDDFIPKLEAMEQPELITLLGEWMLRAACQQAAAWRRAGVDPFRLSVNVSGRQFHQHDLHRVIAAIIRETGFDPYSLELEITERALMRYDKASRDNLQALQDLGVRLAIDDFGVGYSSLSLLRSLPVDTLKIDRMFINDMIGKRSDASIVSAIIAMGRNLDLEVVAEGVETREQMDFLKRHGCHLMQGYLFSRPLPAQEISRFMA